MYPGYGGIDNISQLVAYARMRISEDPAQKWKEPENAKKIQFLNVANDGSQCVAFSCWAYESDL